jgi:hypothetical protein
VPATIDNQIWKKLNQMSCTTEVHAVSDKIEPQLIAYKSDAALYLHTAFHYQPYQLYNLSGQLVQEGIVLPAINISNLSTGAYVLVCNQQAQLFTK